MIKLNDHVIIQKYGGEHSRITKVVADQSILIEKLRFVINGAIDKPYGLYEVLAGKLLPCLPSVEASTTISIDVDESNPSGSVEIGEFEPAFAKKESIEKSREEENEGPTSSKKPKLESEFGEKNLEKDENLVASEPTSSKKAKILELDEVKQILTFDEIQALKDSGISTSLLVSKLVDGNKSFLTRTEYSQVKYVEKKTKKHSDRVLILKPTIRLLAECYYKRGPERIANLRIDLLGLLIEYSCVHVGCNVFVYEETLGLVAASIIERLAGEGHCILLHHHDMPQSIPSITCMGFKENELDTFYPLRIKSLIAKKIAPYDNEYINELMKDEKESENLSEILARRKMRKEREKIGLDLLQLDSETLGENGGSIDSIVLAIYTTDGVDILEKVYPSLRPSGTVSIYSTFQQPLLKAFDWLRKKGAINLQIYDQFYREHQIIPERTHPLMQQLVAGGYLLHGIKVSVSKSIKVS